ncbi:MAG: EamA/RhaT family transporter, partial [Gammaproteobacteria bacterium]|nr:EamA/RhaT family transporter [Gammaproteobacteria bacterium]
MYMRANPATGAGARIQLLIAAVLFSTGGAAIKAVSLNAWQVTAFRCAVAALTLLLFLPETRRGWSWRLLPVALAYAATMLFFVAGNKLTTAA